MNNAPIVGIGLRLRGMKTPWCFPAPLEDEDTSLERYRARPWGTNPKVEVLQTVLHTIQ